MVREKILVIDDEEAIRWTLTESLRGWGYTPVECETAGAALEALEANQTAAVLLDINLPDGSGLDVLRQIKRRQPEQIVIMITANVLVDQTIAALRYGAYDFISKPINLEELQVSIRNGIEAQRLRREVRRIHGSQAKEFGFDSIIGESPAVQETLVEPSRGGGRRSQSGGDVAAGLLARLLADRGVLVEGQGAGARARAAHAEGVGRGDE